MDLCNPTGDVIRGMFDSVSYTFKPRAILTVPDEAGLHLLAQLKKYGVVDVHFGDEPDKIRYAGLLARTIYYRQILEDHKIANARQEELKFPRLVESDAVKQARLALPLYESHLQKLHDKFGGEAEAAYAKDLEEILDDATMRVPTLADAHIGQLREEATKRGIEFGIHWTAHDLRTAINEFDRNPKPVEKQAEPTPAGGVSGSVVVPGPNPDVPPDDLGGAFTRD